MIEVRRKRHARGYITLARHWKTQSQKEGTGSISYHLDAVQFILELVVLALAELAVRLTPIIHLLPKLERSLG